MKVLFLKGDDFAALEFETEFKYTYISDIMEDIVQYDAKFSEVYDGWFDLEVRDLNIDEKAFNVMQSFFGDYDGLKSQNAYLENTIL